MRIPALFDGLLFVGNLTFVTGFHRGMAYTHPKDGSVSLTFSEFVAEDVLSIGSKIGCRPLLRSIFADEKTIDHVSVTSHGNHAIHSVRIQNDNRLSVGKMDVLVGDSQ